MVLDKDVIKETYLEASILYTTAWNITLGMVRALNEFSEIDDLVVVNPKGQILKSGTKTNPLITISTEWFNGNVIKVSFNGETVKLYSVKGLEEYLNNLCEETVFVKWIHDAIEVRRSKKL